MSGGTADPDLARVLTGLARSISEVEEGTTLVDRLCRAAADLLGCDGGSVTLAYTEAARTTLTSTDATADAIESRQDVVQQGPGADAYLASEYRSVVVEPGGSHRDGWPLLDLSGVDDGHPVVVHAVPMRVGNQTVGVLTLWKRGRTSALDPSAADVVAGVVAAALVHEVAEEDWEDGEVMDSWAEHSEVHRAVGFVAARLGVPADDALALLRASAYVHGRTMTATARDVVAGRLTLSDDPGDGTAG